MVDGSLEIQLNKAQLTRDTEMFGSMSPYVVLTQGESKFKSTVLVKAGKLPDFKGEKCVF